jgi:hypothetical protein
VDEEAGPFQYVKGSTAGGRYGDLWPWEPLKKGYPPEDLVERNVPESEVMTLTAPAGTIILCDTAGFHRGGFAKSKPRIMSKHTYVSPATVVSDLEGRTFTMDLPADDARFSPAARFAVT